MAVVQLRRRRGLGPEPTQEGLTVGQAGVQDLDRTRRWRRTSSARYTWAAVPEPRGAVRRYREPRTRPIWSVIWDMATSGQGYRVGFPSQGPHWAVTVLAVS